MKDIMKTLPGWVIPTVIFFLLGMFAYSLFAGSYNRLVTERQEAITQESQIETQMQRRADLVPNIVAATKGGMTQEKAVFASISKAYSAYQQAPSGSSDKVSAGDNLGAALRGYLVVVQQYPNLRSLDLVKDLTTTLEGTENRISVARQRYNESVQTYDRDMQLFPTNIVAGMYGFQQMKPFTADTNGQKVPQVNL